MIFACTAQKPLVGSTCEQFVHFVTLPQDLIGNNKVIYRCFGIANPPLTSR